MFRFDFVMIDPPWRFDLRSEKGEAKAPQGQYACMSIEDIQALPVGNLLGAGGVLWCWCTWPLIAQQTRCIEGWGFRIKSGGAWLKRTPSGKLRVGTGYVWRSVCEPILIATIGDKHDFKSTRAVNLIESTEPDPYRNPLGRSELQPETSRHPAARSALPEPVRNPDKSSIPSMLLRHPPDTNARLIDTLDAFGLDGLARQHSRKPEEAYDLVDALLPSHARKADIFSRQVRPGWDSWGDQVDKFEALP